ASWRASETGSTRPDAAIARSRNAAVCPVDEKATRSAGHSRTTIVIIASRAAATAAAAVIGFPLMRGAIGLRFMSVDIGFTFMRPVIVFLSMRAALSYGTHLRLNVFLYGAYGAVFDEGDAVGNSADPRIVRDSHDGAALIMRNARQQMSNLAA